MKRIAIHFVVFLWVGIAAIGIEGCGGTETGNPARGEQPLKPGTGSPQNPLVSLMDTLCGKLTECLHQVTDTSCRVSVANSPTLGQRLGADPGLYPTFLDLLVEVQQPSTNLTIDEDEFKGCMNALGQLSCEDERLQAIEVGDDGMLANLDLVIPEDYCPGVFSVPHSPDLSQR